MLEVFFQDRLLGQVGLVAGRLKVVADSEEFDLNSYVATVREAHGLLDVTDKEFFKSFPAFVTGYYFTVPVSETETEITPA